MTVAIRSRSLGSVKRRASASSFIMLSVFAGLAAFAVQDVDARGPGGGGFRGGGAGISRGGGLAGRSGAGGIQRPAGAKQRPNATGGQRFGNGQGTGQLGQDNRGTAANNGAAVNRSGNTGVTGSASGNTRSTGNGNRNTAANGNTGVAGSGNGNGSGNVGNGNVNNGNVGSGNGNTGVVNNGNVVAGNDVDIDVDGGWGGAYPYGTGAAYATGVAVGATTSAAVVGSYYATLPASCAPYYYGAYRYYSCGSTWYQQQVQGSSTVYVVVSDPTKSR